MKKHARLLLLPLLFAFLAANTSAQELKVLTIGNSFADNLTAFLPEIAAAGNKPLMLARANIGGCSFQRHARHLAAALKNPDDTSDEARAYKNNPAYNLPGRKKVTLVEALSAQPWDIVTIQQASPLSFKAETYEPYASEVIAAVRKFAPTATILIHQTWAWREDDSRFKDGFTQQKMFADLVAAYRQLADRHKLQTIPSGTAVQNARKTPRWTYRPDPDFDYKNPPAGKVPDQSSSLQVGWVWKKKKGKPSFTADTIHLNDAGRYLTGCLSYEMLWDANCLDVSFVPKNMSAEAAASLRKIAHETPRERINRRASASQ